MKHFNLEVMLLLKLVCDLVSVVVVRIHAGVSLFAHDKFRFRHEVVFSSFVLLLHGNEAINSQVGRM